VSHTFKKGPIFDWERPPSWRTLTPEQTARYEKFRREHPPLFTIDENGATLANGKRIAPDENGFITIEFDLQRLPWWRRAARWILGVAKLLLFIAFVSSCGRSPLPADRATCSPLCAGCRPEVDRVTFCSVDAGACIGIDCVTCSECFGS
jgi:hypothetical protein